MSPFWLKPREPEPGISQGKLLALGVAVILAATLNLMVAVLKLSDGKAIGALYLIVALLLGGVGVKGLREARKRRHGKPPGVPGGNA